MNNILQIFYLSILIAQSKRKSEEDELINTYNYLLNEVRYSTYKTFRSNTEPQTQDELKKLKNLVVETKKLSTLMRDEKEELLLNKIIKRLDLKLKAYLPVDSVVDKETQTQVTDKFVISVSDDPDVSDKKRKSDQNDPEKSQINCNFAEATLKISAQALNDGDLERAQELRVLAGSLLNNAKNPADAKNCNPTPQPKPKNRSATFALRNTESQPKQANYTVDRIIQ